MFVGYYGRFSNQLQGKVLARKDVKVIYCRKAWHEFSLQATIWGEATALLSAIKVGAKIIHRDINEATVEIEYHGCQRC